MLRGREVNVHLLPSLVAPERLRGGAVVVIDVLRAGTTIVHALAAGCTSVVPCTEVDEAHAAAERLRKGKVILGGERGGRPIPGFHLGNSPQDCTPAVCKGATFVLTTTNGTRALLHAAGAERVLVAGFVNFSAICEQLLKETRPIHILCAGTDSEVTLEDTLLAGAFVEAITAAAPLPAPAKKRKGGTAEPPAMLLNDSARVAWDCYEHHGMVVEGALRLSRGGAGLLALGYEDDLRAAAVIDRFSLVPELLAHPCRIELTHVAPPQNYWPQR